VGVEARPPEREGSHRRARSDAALEHDRTVHRQGFGGLGERGQLDVAGARNVTHLTFVRLADVDQLDLPRGK
jgi:hypothetical protein